MTCWIGENLRGAKPQLDTGGTGPPRPFLAKHRLPGDNGSSGCESSAMGPLWPGEGASDRNPGSVRLAPVPAQDWRSSLGPGSAFLTLFRPCSNVPDGLVCAEVVELVDARDSKSRSRKRVRVQFPPWAPFFNIFVMKKSKYGLSLKPSRAFFRTLVVAIAVIFIWRGAWNLMDMYLFPETPVVSNIIGVVIGLMLLYLPDGDLKELA